MIHLADYKAGNVKNSYREIVIRGQLKESNKETYISSDMIDCPMLKSAEKKIIQKRED